ncbi:MAG: class I SAM-dependent methyltransferase [Chlorobium sp.]|nr:class I SAM-dependent methyltransferase [Chlorobium sp.]
MVEKVNYSKSTEAAAIVERYSRRNCIAPDRYSLTNPSVYMAYQERQRAILNFFAHYFPVSRLLDLKLMEVGCGDGKNLLDFLRFGFMTQNLSGIELLPERVAAARKILPTELTIHEGDANVADIAANSQDIVFQSVVFSSILDANFQQELARRMWQWVRPGGGGFGMTLSTIILSILMS